MADRSYGLADLVDALVDARRGQPERAERLWWALGIEPTLLTPFLSGKWREGEFAYGYVLDSVLESLGAIVSPFAGMLEAPRDVIRLYQHHGPLVADAVEQARTAVREVGVDLLVFMLHVPRGMTVSAADHPELDPPRNDLDDW